MPEPRARACSPLGCWHVRAITIVDGRIGGRRAARSRSRADDRVVVRVHGAGLEPGRPPAARGPLSRAARLAARHPGHGVRGRRRSGRSASATASRSATACSASPAAARRPSTSRCPAAQCAIVPDGLDLVAMGGVPEAFVTAHDAIVTPGARRSAGEWVLVHAVGSGVGTAALQLATALGARVVGTARTASKLERCRALGLDARRSCRRTDRRRSSTSTRSRGRSSKRPTAARTSPLDLVGGDYVEADVARGRAARAASCCIGTIAGGRGDAADPCRSSASGSRSSAPCSAGRDVAEKAAATDAFVRDVVPLLADGRDRADRRGGAPARPGGRRLRRCVASDATFGKVILDCR